MDDFIELLAKSQNMTNSEAKELMDTVSQTIGAVADDNQQAFYAGITKIARINHESERQVAFDIAKSIYKTAQIYKVEVDE